MTVGFRHCHANVFEVKLLFKIINLFKMHLIHFFIVLICIIGIPDVIQLIFF